MSGVDLDGREIRKGAADCDREIRRRQRRRWSRRSCGRSSTGSRGRAARRWWSPSGSRALGVVHLKDIVKGGIQEKFADLRAMGIKTVMITGDNPLTAASIAEEAGVDDFLAQATPEDKMALIKKEQQEGKLVAMTGDGTNDAPALAQADVGVAMNTGTQAAKEAGNMVDLDSSPTKLIDIVEIGKQLLMTRGRADDVLDRQRRGEVLRDHPGDVRGGVPGAGGAEHHGLKTPESAILSAVIFNALIIVALVPLALRGVPYKAMSAEALLRRNLLIYGARRPGRAVCRDQDHRRDHHDAAAGVMRQAR